ncbi:helix-turn-helix domain-containing protein [Sphingobium sp. EP60837]|uniref:helix-turn-helix domain-containing protein n=1 Tax=Sphingobium sp. EP60837 TaxID=1855519 RepID=UPI00082BD07F|nr:helix-turn-helix transcriptional regulator [Sphingobium sp. EP60837]
MADMIDWHNPKTLGAALKRFGMTYPDFAAVAGISRSSVIRLVHGKNKPNWATQQKVERALAQAEKSACNCVGRKGAKKGYAGSDKAAGA